jgi:hypothetical protein
VLTVRPDASESFWIVDADWAGLAEETELHDGAAVAYRCPLLTSAGPVPVAVSVWSGPPSADAWGDRPFWSPSGAVAGESFGVRAEPRIRLDGPGLYWVMSQPVRVGVPPAAEEQVHIWRVLGQVPAGRPLFSGQQQPDTVAEDAKPEIRQTSRSEVPSDELHPRPFC